LFRDGPGLVVLGEEGAVARFVDEMLRATGSGAVLRRDVTTATAVAAHIAAVARTHSSRYVELSPETIDRLDQKRVIPTGDGYFRGYLRERSDGHFAGFVDWRPANLGPEQALSMQTLAVHLALQAAIRDVLDAIERVEGKIDNLVKLARAERLGAVAADRVTLEAIVRRVRASGQVSATDWSTVDTLGADILRGIEALRAYVMQEVADLEPSRLVRSRSAELGELTEELLRESLALLVLAEQNYALWQEIRVANVATHERAALGHTLADVRDQLKALSAADQLLIDALHASALELLKPTGFEGLAPLAKHKLGKRGDEVEELIAWFANQRHLDAVELETTYPSFGQSVGKALDAAVEGVGAAGKKALKLAQRSEPRG